MEDQGAGTTDIGEGEFLAAVHFPAESHRDFFFELQLVQIQNAEFRFV